MIFILLGIIGCYLLFKANTYNDEGKIVVGAVLTVCSPILFLLAIGFGYSTYPDLIGEKAKYETLVSCEETIKATYLNVTNSGNEIIAGSLDNNQHSSNLYDFEIRKADIKAGYNQYLIQSQFYEQSWPIRIFWHGMFISSEVQNLVPL